MQHQRAYGIVVAVVGLVLLVAFWTYFSGVENRLASEAILTPEGVCTHPETLECPYLTISKFAPTKYGILGVGVLIVIVGVYMIVSGRSPHREPAPKRMLPADLTDEQKQVVRLIEENNGSIFQHELAAKTGWSKVKVTRILDKLEAREVIERKRRGMTNIVTFRR